MKQECTDAMLLTRRRALMQTTWLAETEPRLPVAQCAGLSSTAARGGSQSHSADSRTPDAANTINHNHYFTVVNTNKYN